MLTLPNFPLAGMWRRWQGILLLLAVMKLSDGVTSSTTSTTTVIADQASPSYTAFAKSISMRKCKCNKYQAWDGSQCVVNSNNIVGVFFNHSHPQKDESDKTYSDLELDISLLENVTVGEIQCPQGLFATSLTDYFFLPNGQLKLKSDVYHEFCIEIFLEDGYSYPEAHVCLPPPAVPVCCPSYQILNHEGSCQPHDFQYSNTSPLQVGSFTIEWPHVRGEVVSLACTEYEYLRRISLSSGEGKLFHNKTRAKLFWQPPIWIASHKWNDDYCVGLEEDGTGELQYVARFCLRDHSIHHELMCTNHSCVRKCCSQNELFWDETKACADILSDDEKWHWGRLPNQVLNEDWKLVYGETGCASTYAHMDQMHLFPNGSLQTEPSHAPIPPNQYCLDHFLDSNESIRNFALVCFPPEDYTCLWRDILINILLGLSCVFLILTLVVYLGVAELRDRTNGRCLISMMCAMLTAYICVIANPLASNAVIGCYAKAFVGHFSSLAMFFWLNVMCFDMWTVLRSYTKHSHGMKKFVLYSVYAWGCPLVISIVALTMDLVRPSSAILPNYYDGNCVFNENSAYWLYLAGFILVLVLVNLMFFLHVAITLNKKMKQRKETFETNNSRTSKSTKTNQQFWLYVKLFVVMGVVWIADVLSLIHRKSCSYWVLADIINALQGVFIFIVAICNKDNLKKVQDAWRPRLQRAQKTLSTLQGHPSRPRATSNTNTLSIDDTEASRKTSITSLPRKLSQVSNFFFSGSSSKTSTLNLSDSHNSKSQGARKGSNVSGNEIITLSTMKE